MQFNPIWGSLRKSLEMYNLCVVEAQWEKLGTKIWL